LARADFIGEVLNPKGDLVFVTYEVFRKLKKLRIADRDTGEIIKAIKWNKPRGMFQMTALVPSLLDLWKYKPEFKHKPLGAINPERIGEGGPSRDSGRANRIHTTLGPDLSGLPVMDTKQLRRLGARKEPDVPLPKKGKARRRRAAQ
jgi:hypothetical protein